MTFRAAIVIALLAAIVLPVLVAEIRRRRPRATRSAKPRAPRIAESAKTPLRLVVNRSDMDRELAALLAKNARKPTETDD